MKILKSLAVAFAVACLALPLSAGEVISANDAPLGWASYAGSKDLAGNEVTPPDAKIGTKGGAGSKVVVTVSDRESLLKALTMGESRIIYVKGLIDMTDTGKGSLLPRSATGSTVALDNLVKDLTAKTALPATSYADWKSKYTASFNYDEDQSGAVKDVRTKLNEYWRELTFLRVQNNTTIIGLDKDSGITGGSWSIKNVENIVIRNLDISNCYNPFPKIEAKDGLNADFDCISISGSKYIWIDHCTVYPLFSSDEIAGDKYKTKDGTEVKWQVYDGLCDITNTNDFVTVSWCIFRNHDKTMLIGNSDSKVADRNHQTITLHHNWYDSCTQRLPMVRFATLHIYNNLYTNTKSRGIDRRAECRIYSEANYFDNTEKSITTNTHGSLFDLGSYGIKTANLSKKAEWIPSDYYSYKADPASSVKKIVSQGAGSGKVEVRQ